jgi:hypothetical protein
MYDMLFSGFSVVAGWVTGAAVLLGAVLLCC